MQLSAVDATGTLLWIVMLLCFAALMSIRRINSAFDRWRTAGRAMVLATVFETVGSTYSKAGHRMLIADNGDYQGLVSGGCLEGDLAERASMVLRDQQSAPVSYDLRDDGDDVFGLGVGCNGLIRVFLQPLLAESAYEPYMSLSRLYEAHEPTVTATVIASSARGPAPGSTFVRGPDGAFEPVGDVRFTNNQLRGAFFAELAEIKEVPTGRFLTSDSGIGMLIAPLAPIPRLLVLGAGLDSVPVVRIAAELGWYVTVVDHRPAYLARGDLLVADAAELVDPRGLRRAIDLSLFDAAIVMSHHLETDAMYLQQLATAPLRYLGVLGPTARRQRLVKKLAESAPDLDARLRGPIGIDIGGGTPESIALSILAELQRVFSGQAQ